MVMTYAFEDFLADARAALGHGAGAAELEAVRAALARLLGNTAFVTATCGPDAAPGLKLLHEDATLGFQILAHINDGPHRSPPHDHGRSWAVYGQAIGHTDMTEWQKTRRDAEHVDLTETRRYRLNPGEVGVYADGAIHAIDYPAGSRFIRVTGTNLDRIYREAFDPHTGAIKKMGPQHAS